MNTSTVSARRGLALLTSALLAALVLLALTSGHNRASASPYPPTSACAISTSDQSVQPGDTMSLQGSGFPANSTVMLTMQPATTALGTVRADSDGSFAGRVTIPSSLAGDNHSIQASSAGVTCSVNPFGAQGIGAVATTQQNSNAHQATRGTDALATTGFAALTASVIAVALLAGGALLLLLGRRHRQP